MENVSMIVTLNFDKNGTLAKLERIKKLTRELEDAIYDVGLVHPIITDEPSAVTDSSTK